MVLMSVFLFFWLSNPFCVNGTVARVASALEVQLALWDAVRSVWSTEAIESGLELFSVLTWTLNLFFKCNTGEYVHKLELVFFLRWKDASLNSYIL